MSLSNVVTGSEERSREVEVVAKATWRRFSAEYKVKILRAAEVCTKPGEIGVLLRREGLYASNIKAATWSDLTLLAFALSVASPAACCRC